MQSSSLRTCPSKPLGLYAGLEWGLGDITFLSPFSFSGTKGGKVITFHCAMNDYDSNFNVYIPEFTEDVICLFIPNKDGDNSVLLTKQDCMRVMGKDVSMRWISKKIKKKWAMKTSRTSTA
jgi:hypothetical protein